MTKPGIKSPNRLGHVRRLNLSLSLSLGLGLALTFLGERSHHAATLVVTNLADAGPGSLREAMLLVQDGDDIRIDVRGQIQLSSGPLVAAAPHQVTVTGPGARELAIDGGDADRVWVVQSGARLDLRGMTIQRGSPPGDGQGGGIVNDGVLSLTACAITLCSADDGGGIRNASLLSMTNCLVARNAATVGAGVLNEAGGLLTLVQCTFSDNTNAFFGSGLHTRSNATAILKFCTVAANRTLFFGSTGSAVENDPGGTNYVEGSLLAGHLQATDSGVDTTGVDFRGRIDSLDFNLIESPDFSAAVGPTGNSRFGPDASAGLRPLANYGGPTDTHALELWSDAVDAGPPAGAPATDQRGSARPRNGTPEGTTRADMGAFEFQPLQILLPAAFETLEDAPDASVVAIEVVPGDVDVTPVGSPVQLVLTAGDTNLVPVPDGLVLEGIQPISDPADTGRNLRIRAAPDRFGSTPIQAVANALFFFDGDVAPFAAATNLLVLTVTAVNDRPSVFTPTNVVILEDSGPIVVALTGISAGPNEAQALSLSARSDNAAVTSDPLIAYTSPNTTAVLTLVPFLNAVGTNRIQVIVQDDGGTDLGGTDATTNEFPVVIRPVNDPPSFLPGPDIITLDEAGPQRFEAWAGQVSPGPANEAGQALDFLVDTTEPALFSQTPAIDPQGNLTFAARPGVSGTATVHVVLRDSGGTADGGVDVAPVVAFSIRIVGVPRPGPAAFLAPLDVLEGSTIRWIGDFLGEAPLHLQWSFEGEPMAGETNAVLELTNVRLPRSGLYQLLVTNAFGGFSTNAQLTVRPALNSPRLTRRAATIADSGAPEETAVPPDAIEFPPGARVTLEVEARGSEQLFVQWRLNGVNLTNRPSRPPGFGSRGPVSGVRTNTAGQSNQDGVIVSTLILNDAQTVDAGRYTAVVANGRGAVESPPFELRIQTQLPPPDGQSQWFRNDFLDALTIPAHRAGDGSLTGHNRGFTSQSAEPSHPARVPTNAISGASAIASAWLNWVAPENGVVRFTTAGSGIDTLMEVFTNRIGSVTSITNLGRVIADDDRADFGSSLVRFTANRGQTYHLYLDGYAGATGDLSLVWLLETNAAPVPVIIVEPESDRVAVGQSAEVTLRVTAENLPYLDPPPGGECPGGDVLRYEWFIQQDPETGPVFLRDGQADGSLVIPDIDVDPASHVGVYFVRVFNGCEQFEDSIPALVEVMLADTNSVTAPKLTSLGPVEGRWEDLVPESTGGTSARAGLHQVGKHVGASVAAGILTSNLRAKRQAADPQHCEVIGGSSRWYLLQIAPSLGTADGLFEMNTMGSAVDSLLAVYSPRPDGRLELIACDDNSAPDGSDDALVRFVVQPGASYVVALDSRDGAQGLLQLHCSRAPVPLNNSLLWVRIPGAGDPDLDQVRDGVVDPRGDGLIDEDGIVSVTTDTNTARLFFAYGGADYPLLREVATENPDRCSGHLTNLLFNVNRGSAYLLAVLANDARVESAQPVVRFLPPRLGLARSSDALTLTWEGPYILQSTPHLEPPLPGRLPPWTDRAVGGLGLNAATVPLSLESAFFRLRRGERAVLGYTGCLPIEAPFVAPPEP